MDKWDILGLYRDNGKQNGNYYNRVNIGICWGFIGIMEKEMETTINGYMSGYKMEKKMETTVYDHARGQFGSLCVVGHNS